MSEEQFPQHKTSNGTKRWQSKFGSESFIQKYQESKGTIVQLAEALTSYVELIKVSERKFQDQPVRC